ncbi:MAG: DUF2231 domain-containing protein [Phycisphaerae bacterium]
MSLKNILQGRPFGHPLHPLLVHFPLGIWLFALILDIVGTATANPWTLSPALICLLAGDAVAILAAITGFTDWFSIRADHPARPTAFWHLALMLPATLLFLLDALVHLAILHRPALQPLGLALSAFAYTITLIGGYLGGRLVYQNGISVGRHRRTLPLPQNTLIAPHPMPDESPLADGFHPMFPEAALPEGGTLRAECEGTVITFARANGTIYAVQEFCTHRCGPLSEGAICGTEIECPWHRSRFDLRTGKPTHGPAKIDLKTFEVQSHQGIIHLRLSPPPEEPTRPDTRTDTRTSPRRNPTDSPTSPNPSPRPTPQQSQPPRLPHNY